MIAVFISALALRIFVLWEEGPWDLPKPSKGKEFSVVEEREKEPPQKKLASTRNIIDRNLFDPERGANQAQEAESSSIAMQRLRSMVLLGTAILGNNRFAILQEPSDSRPSAARTQPGQPNQLRLKLGDTVEGFRLSEIQEKKVVFTKGASKVEVSLDFLRKFDDAKDRGKAPVLSRPGVVPRVPGKAPGEIPPPPVTP